MVLLLALPIWVIVLNVLLKPSQTNKSNAKTFMVLTSIALILILGLRTQYTGSRDTEMYFLTFAMAKNSTSLLTYLDLKQALDGFWLFSEAGFHIYTWLLANILPSAQLFLLVSTAIMIILTAKFIWNNSQDMCVSWITFICLGLLTFMMNGLRQTMAMSICLWAYEYAKRKKFIPFLLVVLLAVLFHKSSIVFIFVYGICNMKFNWKSSALLIAVVAVIVRYADSFVMFYDDLTEESYYGKESFESGGLVTILIYLSAIGLNLLFSKKLKEKESFAPLALAMLGLVIYSCRFFSTQIYERISYYFFYFLMIVFPSAINEINPKYRKLVYQCFILLAVMLFAYRISKGAFSNFRLFW